MSQRTLGASLLVALFVGFWLSSPGIVRAVGLNEERPTISTVIYPAVDMYVDSKYPNQSYWYPPSIFVGNSYDKLYKIWGSERILMKFNLTQLSRSMRIVAAELRLFQYFPANTSITLNVHRVLEDWQPSNTTWQAQPRWDEKVEATSISPPKRDVWVAWNVTDLAAAWHKGVYPNYGLLIKIDKEAQAANQSAGFWSMEYPVQEVKPRLVIEYFGEPDLTYLVSVSVSGLPSPLSTALMVDGAFAHTISGNETKYFYFEKGTSHTLSVSKYVTAGTGVRYYAEREIVQVSEGGRYTFSYSLQYLVVVTSDPPGLVKEIGVWLLPGAEFVTPVAPAEVRPSPNTRYVFKGWSMNALSVTGNPVTVTVSSHLRLVAVYKVQHYVNATSPYGNVIGGGWYDEGSTAVVKIEPTFIPHQGFLGSVGVGRVFRRWAGDFINVKPTVELMVDKPLSIRAEWGEDYSNLAIIGTAMAIVAAIITVFSRAARRRDGQRMAAE